MLSHPVTIAETIKKKKDSSSFLARSQPMKSHGWALCLLYLSQLPFPLHKSVLLPFPCGNLYMAHHGYRPWTAVLYWSQINPSFLEKNLAVYCFRSMFWRPVQGPLTARGLLSSWAKGPVPTNETFVTRCFSHRAYCLKVHPSPGFKLMHSLHLNSPSFTGDPFKGSAFLVRPCFVCEYSFGSSGLILRSHHFPETG